MNNKICFHLFPQLPVPTEPIGQPDLFFEPKYQKQSNNNFQFYT